MEIPKTWGLVMAGIVRFSFPPRVGFINGNVEAKTCLTRLTADRYRQLSMILRLGDSTPKYNGNENVHMHDKRCTITWYSSTVQQIHRPHGGLRWNC